MQAQESGADDRSGQPRAVRPHPVVELGARPRVRAGARRAAAGRGAMHVDEDPDSKPAALTSVPSGVEAGGGRGGDTVLVDAPLPWIR